MTFVESAYTIGRLKIDFKTKRVELGEKLVHLLRKEYGVLELLARADGSIVTKRMFLDGLYSTAKREPNLKTIDAFVCYLRKKLPGPIADTSYIQTIWGRGYRLCDPTVIDTHQEVDTDLPKVTGRWTAWRKAELLDKLDSGELTIEDLFTLHGVDPNEIIVWRTLLAQYGVAGLRETRVQEYHQ